MSIYGYSELAWAVKKLRKLRDEGYLEGFCNSHGLNYSDVKTFVDICDSIISRKSDLVKALKEDEKLAKEVKQYFPLLLT